MTDYVAMNMTTSSINGLSSSGSWFGVVALVGIMMLTLGFLATSLSSLNRFRRLMKVILFFGQTLKYFGYGILCIVCLAIPSVIIYYLEKEAVNGNVVPLKYLVGVVLGYAIISGIGYVFKKYVIDKVDKYTKAIKKEEKK